MSMYYEKLYREHAAGRLPKRQMEVHSKLYDFFQKYYGTCVEQELDITRFCKEKGEDIHKIGNMLSRLVNCNLLKEKKLEDGTVLCTLLMAGEVVED